MPIWNRQHQLRGRHATRVWKGAELEQWEYEITSGGRVRYLVSPETSTNHPGVRLPATPERH
ncbi:hypothetical protein ACIF9R_21530 [Streptomyces sp. NPDC086080]|uniref:hypothetical protein n=1 Tax=Streptomyces sp. NPDC086080 TaxID=3365748 RepID=UPI0037D183E8